MPGKASDRPPGAGDQRGMQTVNLTGISESFYRDFTQAVEGAGMKFLFLLVEGARRHSVTL